MSYKQIQKQIDQGLGFAARELGTPHDVYRISSTSTGNVIAPANKVASGVKAFTKIAYGGGVRESFEGEKLQGILWYRVIADLRNFKVGDVFVSRDTAYGPGHSSVTFDQDEQFKGFAIADHSPIKKALAGRINCTVEIHRPLNEPDPRGRFDRTKESALPLVLNAGSFAFVAGQACKLPAGLMAQGRTYGERTYEGVPAEKRRSSWTLYLPAMDIKIREGDRVTGPDGSRYIVLIPFTQMVGASGSQWLLEREGP